MYDSETSVLGLVTAFRSGRLDLPAVLEALSRRGRVPEDEYRAGVETLWKMREEQVLDAQTVTTLVTRLDALREAQEDDATVVAPPARTPAPADDATAMALPASRAAVPPDDDVTHVVPAPVVPGDAQAADGTGTGTGTSTGVETWQRIADAAGGEVARVGMLLKGRFLLEREIGRGGMGVVFLARDERKVEARDRDPYVAVKVLNDEFRRHPDSLVALQRESRRSQLLAHDNIVRVYDFDKAGTIVFMTMEYIDGSDLRTLIREQAWNGMPLAKARPLIEGMARALGRAHAAGIVHSDFKPGNVMVTSAGVPKVFDFGIARAGKHMASATGEQTVFDAATLGALTPAYASLEMIQGKEPTPSDDIYALGCCCFELLTGRHPFGKASAEVALREGRTPPPVPGLTRRQYRTLCDAVAFTREQRLGDVEQLIEGLREVGLRERALPLVGIGAAALVLLGGGGYGLSRHLHDRQIAAAIAGFGDDPGARYADEAQAARALAGLDEEDRRRIVLDNADLVEGFLLSRLDALWNPAAGRHDYAAAQEVFAFRDALRLYSPALDARRTEMAQQRNALLNALDSDLGRRIAAGDLFDGAHDNAAATLATVRAVDPGSALLANPELELAYDAAVAAAVEAGDLDLAHARLARAAEVFPESLRLQLRAGEVETAQLAAQARERALSGERLDPTEARVLLAGRLAAPGLGADWRDEVARALEALEAGAPADVARLHHDVATAIAAATAGVDSAAQLAQATALVDYGLGLSPQAAPLLAERERLAAVRAGVEAELAAQRVHAEVAGRTESARHAAAAGDLDKAREALARIRALQPDNAFLLGEAPQLLSGTYLERAAQLADEGGFAEAEALLADGVETLGSRLDLRTARARYAMAAAVAGEDSVPDAATHARLVEELEGLYRSDASGMEAMEARMRERGQLPDGSLRALLARRAPAPAQPARTARPSAAPEPAAVADPGRRAPRQAAADGDDEPLPPVPDGPDPCGNPALVGRGRFCFDQFGDGRGPTLVVVPGVDGGKAYGLSRAEVTVDDFARFCAATGRCTVTSPGDPALGALPVQNVTYAQASAYARWATRAAGGWRYRLPTEAEWAHAAGAGSGWRQAADSNCVPPTANSHDSLGAPVSARGREPNPWGLINLTGNVWEWVAGDGGPVVRGGSFASYWSDCTVDARRADGGGAHRDVGFRLLRELK
ncbi:protein kinase domain-containing protein [Coralloluteibacterium thermophilus]|uniref:SUMF1/EgtB/PvdO family nonheme iron enzyme n=1 Tax=Coralloluteibacterium thermophilum TaxID=2707049 RepID=A0ABV9NRJ8_9GAMM